MKLFGTDGVRGEAGVELTAFVAMRLAMAAGIYFSKKAVSKRIVVGKDTRKSSYMIEKAIGAGLTAVGYYVIDVGPIPTPGVAFLTQDLRCDAGIMISASHNQFQDNGIKFFDNEGNKLSPKDEEAIEEIYFDENLIISSQVRGIDIGKAKRVDDVLGRYIVHIKKSFPKELTLNNYRIVIDTANGSAYKVAPLIFRELGAEVFVLNNNPDGSNINHECGALYPEKLANKVKELRADLGFACDGDADRIVVVDEKGEVIDGDKLIGAIATHLQKSNKLKNSAICVTLMSNKALEEYLKSFGIKVYYTDVGDKNVLDEMKKRDLNFGGEQSGHIILRDVSTTGDTLASAIKVMAYILKNNQKASQLLNPFELYPQLKENIKVSYKPPLKKIKGYKELIKEFEKKGVTHLIRYSGTEKILRILLEGKDKKVLKRLMQEAVLFFKEKLS